MPVKVADYLHSTKHEIRWIWIALLFARRFVFFGVL